jgi:hypothetical protein
MIRWLSFAIGALLLAATAATAAAADERADAFGAAGLQQAAVVFAEGAVARKALHARISADLRALGDVRQRLEAHRQADDGDAVQEDLRALSAYRERLAADRLAAARGEAAGDEAD